MRETMSAAAKYDEAMRKPDLYKFVIGYFKEKMPVAETELNYTSTYELLVSVILSAQCTDKRVNQVTPSLFKAYPSPHDMAAATEQDIFGYIKSVSYPNSKAKHLVEMAKKVVNDFNGQIPSGFDELLSLPGVGRKTANVMQSVAFNKAALAVDTHVFRVANRIGLTVAAKTPLAVEKQLVKHIPNDLLSIAHHWLILHGRYVCTSRKPHCDECGLAQVCAHFKSGRKQKSTV